MEEVVIGGGAAAPCAAAALERVGRVGRGVEQGVEPRVLCEVPRERQLVRQIEAGPAASRQTRRGYSQGHGGDQVEPEARTVQRCRRTGRTGGLHVDHQGTGG